MVLQVDKHAPEPVGETDQLAQALQSMATAKTSPAAALRWLLDGVLYVAQHSEAGLSEEDVARGRVSLGVYQLDGRDFAPIFTSIEALARFVKPGTGYAALSGRTLLQMWSDDWLIVNPGSRYRLILSPDEVRQIARGDLPIAFGVQSLDKG